MTKTKEIQAVAAPETVEQMRNRYRAKLVGSSPLALVKRVTAFDLEFDLRQPNLGDVLSQGSAVGKTTREQIASYIINFACIPGTSVRIFEEGDEESILAWPFGPEYIRIQEAMNELTGIDIEGAEADLEADPLA